MFTMQSVFIITSIFSIVLLFQFSSIGIEKAINLFNKIKDM